MNVYFNRLEGTRYGKIIFIVSVQIPLITMSQLRTICLQPKCLLVTVNHPNAYSLNSLMSYVYFLQLRRQRWKVSNVGLLIANASP